MGHRGGGPGGVYLEWHCQKPITMQQEESFDRRRAANRQAQAAYRHRQRSRIDELEGQVQALKEELGLSDEDVAASVASSGPQSRGTTATAAASLGGGGGAGGGYSDTASPLTSIARRASEAESSSAGARARQSGQLLYAGGGAGVAERLGAATEHPGLRFLEGVTEVAGLLGVPKGALLSPHELSPFYLRQLPLPPGLGPSIAPTSVQYAYQHHPLIDCIPLPDFRSRLVLALAASPPLLKRAEVFYDLFTGGLTFSGSAYDASSWSFSDHFRAKWAGLLTAPLEDLEAQAQHLA